MLPQKNKQISQQINVSKVKRFVKAYLKFFILNS